MVIQGQADRSITSGHRPARVARMREVMLHHLAFFRRQRTGTVRAVELRFAAWCILPATSEP